jgi:hypothetical protein
MVGIYMYMQVSADRYKHIHLDAMTCPVNNELTTKERNTHEFTNKNR